jgi:hypothetical protein
MAMTNLKRKKHYEYERTRPCHITPFGALAYADPALVLTTIFLAILRYQ